MGAEQRGPVRTYHDKLVRDAFPEIIHAAGSSCIATAMDEPEYRRALLDKLVEEAREAATADPRWPTSAR